MTPDDPATPTVGGTALVLAGGGVAGIAWELGVLRGLAEADPATASRVLAADVVIGTSAGAAVGAQITSGVPIEELYEAQLRPETAEIEVELDAERLFADYRAAVEGASGPQDARRRLGAMALAAQTVAPEVRLAAIDARLPVKDWPERRLLIVAVDADTGEPVSFSRDSDVSLRDAVAASCAVPGVWPPVTIAGRRYVDGGMRSLTNADLATGAERVLVVKPTAEDAPQPWGDFAAEQAALGPAGVHVICADPPSLSAIGFNPLSPAVRAPSARAGRAVGAAQAAAVAGLWR